MAVHKFGVIGAGAWGTALANVVAANGKACVLWAREEEVVNAVNTDHRNPVFLPDVEINPHVRATSDLADACNAEALLFVAPTQHLRSVAESAAPPPIIIDPPRPEALPARWGRTERMPAFELGIVRPFPSPTKKIEPNIV